MQQQQRWQLAQGSRRRRRKHLPKGYDIIQYYITIIYYHIIRRHIIRTDI